MNFNDIEWHDSVLKEIFIDRKNPGENDILVLKIEFENKIFKSILFEDAYWSHFNLNFGVIADETILKAYTEGKDNEDVKKLVSKWNNNLDDVDLNIYIFNLNSTGSVIKIIAKKFTVI